MATARRPRSWRVHSVRARTTLVATIVVGVALTAGSLGLILTLQYSLTRSVDTAAVTRLQDLAALARTGGLPATVTAPSEEDVVQVVDETGAVVATSDNARGQAPIVSSALVGRAPTVRTVWTGLDDDEDEDEPYRVWSRRVQTGDGSVVVHVGSSLEQVAETTAVLRLSLLAGVPLLTAVLAYSTWLLLGRALRPVESIRAEVADISQHALHRRVPVPATDDEVSDLAETMNAMLARLDEASRRQREFVADASHELQSPLASLRAQLEVARAHPDATDWDRTTRDLLGDSDRMERLVRDLLFLARTDALPAEPARDLVDLDDVVLEEARRLRPLTEAEVDTASVSAAPVRGSREDLRRLVRNLLDNAARHAVRRVGVSLTQQGDHVVLTVDDDGPGIPADQRDRVFERFVRLDEARSLRDSGGTGLGLAIVRAIAGHHQGTARVEPSSAGARLVVRLPAAP